LPLWSAGVLLVVLAGAAPSVLAASTCAGTIRSSLVHALPRPMVVMGGVTSIANTTAPELTRRFVDGLRRAGTNIAMADEGNVTLNIAVSVTAPPNASNVISGSYQGFEWVSGGRIEVGQRLPDLRSANLSMSAVLTDNQAATQSWVATVDCRVQTDDPEALAEELGLIIGRAFGTNVQEKRL
jgi:hypothetical protein